MAEAQLWPTLQAMLATVILPVLSMGIAVLATSSNVVLVVEVLLGAVMELVELAVVLLEVVVLQEGMGSY